MNLCIQLNEIKTATLATAADTPIQSAPTVPTL